MRPELPMINWNYFRNNSPKAFSCFWNWVNSNDDICDFDKEQLENVICVMGGTDFTEFIHFNRGDLYSFFDQHKVFLSIIHSERGFTSTINSKEECVHFSSRAVCEQDAFIRAFEELEKMVQDGDETYVPSW